jgi:hypothetical protein
VEKVLSSLLMPMLVARSAIPSFHLVNLPSFCFQDILIDPQVFADIWEQLLF